MGFGASQKSVPPSPCSARRARRRSTRMYTLVREVAAALGRSGYAIITGGGGGLMEAANRGAQRRGRDIGRLQHRTAARAAAQRYVDIGLRVQPLLRPQGDVRALRQRVRHRARGFGTLDELFEALTLIQTATIRHFPAILAGDGEWDGLLEWLRSRALAGWPHRCERPRVALPPQRSRRDRCDRRRGARAPGRAALKLSASVMLLAWSDASMRRRRASSMRRRRASSMRRRRASSMRRRRASSMRRWRAASARTRGLRRSEACSHSRTRSRRRCSRPAGSGRSSRAQDR